MGKDTWCSITDAYQYIGEPEAVFLDLQITWVQRIQKLYYIPGKWLGNSETAGGQLKACSQEKEAVLIEDIETE